MTLKRWIMALLPIGVLFSCTRKEMEKPVVPVETRLESDTVFQQMVKDHLAHYASIKNFPAIREAARDGIISEEEFREYWKYFGMLEPMELTLYYSRMKYRASYLESRYHFSQMLPEQRTQHILKQVRLAWGLGEDTINTERQLLDDDCEKRRVNCLAQAMAETLLMHISCAAMDATVFLGLACHAAATIYQITASNTCNMDFQKCKKQSGPAE